MSWASHIIDANLNRAREGLRVLEELARFVLRDELLSNRIKAMRHQLRVTLPARDVSADPGASFRQSERSAAIHILNANASRVQEALRVLEEYSDDNTLYARLRFETYDIHQSLFLALRRGQLKGLYIIVDPNAYDVSATQVAEMVKTRNCQIVQLRDKLATKSQMLERARSLREALPADVLLVVNDHFDVALAVADGVHLGQSDFPVKEAVRIGPPHFIVGASANNVNEAKAAQDAGASYVAMGCVFGTKTKSDAKPIEISEIVRARAVLQIPLCVIGGITEQNMPLIKGTKANLYAMCRSVWRKQL